MKLHLVAFGCQMSVADSEEMARPLLSRGFSLTPDLDSADAVILNTCTVRQHAEDRAVSLLGRLRPWKEARPERLLIVAGCAAERLGERLPKKFPHIDLVSGAKSIGQYPDMIEKLLRERFDWARENAGVWPEPAAGRAPARESALPAVCAYVTVMRGCNYSCSYCVVPSVRGREIYRPLAAVLSETRERVAEGAREVMFLGQTVNSYQSKDGGGADFAELLRAAEGVGGLERIRFMSPHPHYLDARMIRAMADSAKAARHLHLPLQSGSDRMLRAMRRNYTVRDYLRKVENLRRAAPGIELTTDMIAGFPGETPEDFEGSLQALRALGPCSAYCFKFSVRPGTGAAAFPGRLPEPVIEERHRRLLELTEELRRGHLKSLVGRKVRILLENGRQGRTEGFFNARLEEPGRAGEIVEATVTGTSRTGLKARRD